MVFLFMAGKKLKTLIRNAISYKPYLVLICFLFFAPFKAYSLDNRMIVNQGFLLPVRGVSGTLIPLWITIFCALVVITLLIVFFSRKIGKINDLLNKKTSELEKSGHELNSVRKDLEEKKEDIIMEYYKSGEFSEMLIQAADDGISFYDEKGNLRLANKAFYSMTGYDKTEYESLAPDILIHQDDLDYNKNRIEALNNRGFYECELRLKHRDNHFITLSTKSVVVKDDAGKMLGSLTISRDITRLTQMYEELVKANMEAEASSRLKSSFLANISHEIRTPLNSVVGFSNLLLSDSLSREVKEEYIEHINHNSEKLLQIIGDIIDLSRLESSQIEITYEEASVISIVNEVAEEVKQVIQRNEKPIIMSVKNLLEDNGDLIFTDKIWLKRVLNHLMDNAVKFTLDGSIELSYCREDQFLVFKIKDTGIGINRENLARIFEEFRQEINGHRRPFEGLGIGLTLAKEVVERMGGSISVQSEKGVGSEFSFTIPYRPAGSTKTKIKPVIDEQAQMSLNWSSKKCLLVDDNKDVLLYLKRILLDTGINIITARSGVEAIKIIKNDESIDVVLLDMQMPEMNGIEATKMIRTIKKDLPIIAQTAFIFEDDKDIILQAGCDACLIKPIRKEHLLAVMTSFIKTA